MKKVNLLIVMLALAAPVKAQFRTASQTDSIPNVWTLERCIEYAKENNLKIREQQVSKKSSDEDVAQAKAALYPTLSLSGNGQASFSNTSTYNDYNESTGTTSFSGSIGLNSGLTLYRGGRIRNALKQARTNNEAAVYDLEQSRFDIEAQVIQQYLQIMYDNESLDLAVQAEQLSEMEVDRALQMYEAGAISKSDLAQLQSTNASDKYNIVTAQNSLATAKLSLKQLLELGAEGQFDIEFPGIGDEAVTRKIPDLVSIYSHSLENLPSMKSAALNVDAADVGVMIAKGAYLPTLSLSAGVNTGAYSGTGVSFIDQLNNKLGESVGLSLSLPIFDQRSNKTTYNKAKLSSDQARLQQKSSQNSLLSTLESMRNDAVAAQSLYLSSSEQLAAQKVSYEIVSEQFNAGFKNTVELITEKNNYISAQSKQLQAKYQAVLSLKLLDMYMNL
jgi:outer membrane protein